MSLRLSYSKISTYEQCPYKYKRVYIDNFQEKPKWQLCLGLSAADIVEHVHKNGLADLHYLVDKFWIPKQFQSTFSSSPEPVYKLLGYRSIAEEESQKELLVQYLVDFFSYYGVERQFGVEVPFEIAFDSHKISGRIDLIKLDKISTSLYIIDNKLTSRFIDDLQNSMQLAIYFLAMSQILKRFNVSKVGYYYFKFAKEVLIDASNLNLDGVRDRVYTVINGIEQGWFNKKTSGLCSVCDLKKECKNG